MMNPCYSSASGLCDELVQAGLLDLWHLDPEWRQSQDGNASLFETLPYEWCFSQLCDAAELVLEIQARAMERGFSLTTVSPFNVRFAFNRPVWTYRSAFEVDDGGPWKAYESFCRQYLATLLLMRYRDPSSNLIFRDQPQALPLLEVSRMLRIGTYFDIDCLLHIHLHSRAHRNLPQGFFLQSGEGWKSNTKRNLVDSLRKAISTLRRKASIAHPQRPRGSQDCESNQFRHRFVREVAGLWTPRDAVVVGEDYDTHGRVLAAEAIRCAVLQSDPDRAEHIYARSQASTPVITSDPFEVLNRWQSKVDLLLAFSLSRSFGSLCKEDLAALLHRSTRLLLIESGPEGRDGNSRITPGITWKSDFETVIAFLSPWFTALKIAGIPSTRRQMVLLRSNFG
jgi:hypothetical protein